MKLTKGDIDLGHFWNTKFCVPDPPSPSSNTPPPPHKRTNAVDCRHPMCVVSASHSSWPSECCPPVALGGGGGLAVLHWGKSTKGPTCTFTQLTFIRLPPPPSPCAPLLTLPTAFNRFANRSCDRLLAPHPPSLPKPPPHIRPTLACLKGEGEAAGRSPAPAHPY